MKRIFYAWIAVVIILSSVVANEAKAQTWDFDVSGAVNGIAYLTFNDDRTVNGYLAVATGNLKTEVTGSQGSFAVGGTWGRDPKGNTTVALHDSSTGDDIQLNFLGLSGKISKNGGKFTLSGQVANADRQVFGKVTFKGVPARELVSLVAPPYTAENEWEAYLVKAPNKEVVIYYLTVAPFPPYMNTYVFNEETSQRCVRGSALFSQGNNLALVLAEKFLADGETCADVDFEEPDEITAVTGKLKLKSGVAKLVGGLEGEKVEDSPDPKDKMTLFIGD